MAYRLEVAFAQFAGPCEYHLETLKSSSFIGKLLFLSLILHYTLNGVLSPLGLNSWLQ